MTKPRPLHTATLLLALAALAGGGCAGDDDPEPAPDRPPQREVTGSERVIRGWIGALNRSDYERAASFFARGAIVDQGVPVKLRDRKAAVLFNRAFPCRADLLRVKNEGQTALGSFRLRVGPAGTTRGCDSTVRVRFTVRDGRISVWRQLPAEDGAPADGVPA